MSILSDALLKNLLKQGIPVLIISQDMLEEDDDDLEEGITKGLSRSFFSPVMPSPVPG